MTAAGIVYIIRLLLLLNGISSLGQSHIQAQFPLDWLNNNDNNNNHNQNEKEQWWTEKNKLYKTTTSTAEPSGSERKWKNKLSPVSVTNKVYPPHFTCVFHVCGSRFHAHGQRESFPSHFPGLTTRSILCRAISVVSSGQILSTLLVYMNRYFISM